MWPNTGRFGSNTTRSVGYKQMMQQPELLAPAGNPRTLKTALRFGADAVYVGMERHSLRAHAANFSREALREAVEYTHTRQKRIYVALNILPFQDQMEALLEDARFAQEVGIDAAIVADPGVVAMLRDALPDLPLHLSTQANTLNAHAARFWHSQGVERIILARELSVDRIAAMRALLPSTLALEAFVHGAVCMSYSGRCLLSAALNDRSANQGDCTQPCRWQYALLERSGKHPHLLVDATTQGTAILSAQDLCMLGHLPALRDAGLSSLKIEGRMKSEYYVATVVGAYRRALDALAQDPTGAGYTALLPALMTELCSASHHDFDTGFYFGPPVTPGGAGGYTQTAEYVGYVEQVSPQGLALVEVKNRFFVGDSLALVTPGGAQAFSVTAIALAETGEEVDSVRTPLTMVRMAVPVGAKAGDLLRGPCRNHTVPSS